MAELVDLVDAEGRVVCRGVSRDVADTVAGVHLQIVIVVLFGVDGLVLIHRRASSKRVDPGRIDHVCGAVAAGETPYQAAVREAREELGVDVDGLHIVEQGVNGYGRYRYLMAGYAGAGPGVVDPGEVAWAGWERPEVLEEPHRSGEWAFVDEFFDDLAAARSFLAAANTSSAEGRAG